MKKLLWLLLIFCPLKAWGFIAADENLTRLNQTVLVESYADKADVTITHTLKNSSDEALVFDYLLPVRNGAKPPTAYWNSAGKTMQALAPEQAAATVFDLAKNYNQPAWLGAMDESFNAWWQVEDIELKPHETATLKIEYQVTLDFFEDVYLGHLWLADGRISENLIINLVRAGAPVLWEAALGEWIEQKTNQAWAKQWEAQNIKMNENLTFFASDVPAASLAYNFLNQTYKADFQALVDAPPQRVVLVMDTSGSVYGVRLERLKQALRTVLETLPETTSVKLALASDELEWLQTEWTPNNRENQRETLAFVEGAQAQGRTHWESLISELNLTSHSADGGVGLVWLGDFSDMPQPMLNRLANASWRVLMVDFWQSQSGYLQRWWQRYEGQYVPLFNSGYELVEADALKAAWRNLGQQWPEDQALNNTNSGEWFEPVVITQANNNKSLGQVSRTEVTSSLASFLPRWWAQFKIADYLRQHEGLPLNEAQIQAVLSIAHAFGVNIGPYNGKSGYDALATYLKAIETDTLWDEILRLSTTPTETDIKYWHSRPFYLVDNTWEPFDWDAYNARPDRPVLERWSAAHKNLFETHYALLAKPMSFGANVAFCAAQRCASVDAQGRAMIAPTDTLLWGTKADDHWALNYWADLVWANVLEDRVLETTNWSESVSRGQFLVWLQRQLAPQAIMPPIEAGVFSDLNENQTGSAQALWFQQQGLFNGYSDGTARLETPLLRIEGLKLLMTAYGLDTRDVLGNYDPQMPFSDLVGWTQPWGYEAYLRGLVAGYDDGTFRPFQPLSNAESYKLLITSKQRLTQ